MIDFEEKFAQYISDYEKENANCEDHIEDLAPDLYLQWLRTPQDWLEGKTPEEHFESFDAQTLIKLLGEYILSDVSLPGALLNRIADTREETYPYLINLLTNYEGDHEDRIKTTIVRLIEEMDFSHPYDYYIEAISEADAKSDFVESAAKELKNTDGKYLESLIKAYEQAKNQYVGDCLLDILCDISLDRRIFQFALEKFLYSNKSRAFYASCLGKLGYEDAMPYLEEALREDNLGYFDYTAIKYSIEELGGEVTIDRDFTGDSDYESLKHPKE